MNNQTLKMTWPVIRDGLGLLSMLAWARIAVAGVQRGLWLSRPDPYGQPMVARFEWYWFHAVAGDAWEAAWLAVPAAVVLVLASHLGPYGRGDPTWQRRLAWIYAGLLVVVTGLAQVDQELMRFVGGHLSVAVAKTYCNYSSFLELWRQLGADAGGPGVGGLSLLLGCGALLWRAKILVACPPTGRRASRAAGGLMCLLGAGWLLTEVVWPGHFRAWRVAGPLKLAVGAVVASDSDRTSAADLEIALTEHHQRWLAGAGQPAGAGGVATHGKPRAYSQQAFAVPEFPLYHATPHRLCRLLAQGLVTSTGLGCHLDRDGDGAPLASDCDDGDPRLHPGAVDFPGNGVDEDCSGLDAAPWNVLVVLLESHRAVDVGHLRASDRRPSATPKLDALAAHSVAFVRASSNGVPTISSFMAFHTGLLPHPDQYVATGFAHLQLPGLPRVLSNLGFSTAYFSAPDPAWDNQSVWLGRWYDSTDHDPNDETDAALFERMARRLLDDLGPKSLGAQARPFFAVAITKSNHFPFERIAGVEVMGGDRPKDRIRDTMRYTDAGLGRLLDVIAEQPWFERTVVIVTADHGFPLGEHGDLKLYETVHVEATGVPLVLAGAHPKLLALSPRLRTEPASHVDLAPTILDLIGADSSGAWMGRSLVASGGRPTTAIVTSVERAIERGPLKVIDGPPGRGLGLRVYDRLVDPGERDNLVSTLEASQVADIAAELERVPALMRAIYRNGRIWPPWAL